MPEEVIGRALVEIVPDLKRFAQETGQQVKSAMRGVEGSVEKPFKDANANVRKDFQRTTEDVRRHTSGLGRSIKSLLAPAIGAFSVLGAIGIARGSIDTFKDTAVEVLRLQRVAGGTAEEMSRLRFAAEHTGVSTASLTNGLKLFGRNLVAAQGSTKKTAALTHELGFSFEDAHGKLLPMDQLIPKVADKFKSMPNGAEKTALAMKLFGRSGADLIPVLNQGSAGLAALGKESDKMGTTLSGKSLQSLIAYRKQQREFSATMEGLRLAIGGALIPILTKFAAGVNHLIEEMRSGTGIGGTFVTVFNNMRDVIKSSLSFIDAHRKLMTGLAVAIGTVVLATKAHTTALAIQKTVMDAGGLLKYIKSINVVRTATLAWSVAQTILDAAFSPVGLIVIGIGLLVAGIILAYKHSKTFRDIVNSVGNAIKTGLLAAINALVVAFHAVVNAAKVTWAALVTAWGAVKAAITTGINAIVSAFHAVVGAAQAVWKAIVTAFNAVKSAITAAINGVITAFHAVISAAQAVWHALVSAFNAVKGAISTAINAVVGAFKTVVSVFASIIHTVVSVFTAVVKAISGPAAAVVSVLKSIWSRIYPILVLPFYIAAAGIKAAWKLIQGAFSAVTAWVKNVFAVVWRGIQILIVDPLVLAWKALVKIWNDIKAAFTLARNWVVGVFSKAWYAVVAVLSVPLNAAKRVIDGIWTAIKKAFMATRTWVVNTFSRTWAAVATVLSRAVQAGKQAIDAIWKAIRAAFLAAKNWVVNVFSRAWAAVANVLSRAVLAGKKAIDLVWTAIKTAFTTTKNWVVNAFSRAWAATKGVLEAPVRLALGAIKGLLSASRGGLQYVFRGAVSAIGAIWSGLKALAKAPINFIVGTVLNNGLIGGFNWIANKFGAPTIKPIPWPPKGWAAGGPFTGKLPGAPSMRDNLLGFMRRTGRAFGLAGGEFIVNARQTAKHLPTLHAINSGKEGYAGGGLIGGLKNAVSKGFSLGKSFVGGALDFLKDPIGWLKQRFAGPLGKLSQLGSSPIAQMVKSVPQKIAATIYEKAKDLIGLGAGPAGVGPGITLNIGPQVGTGANRWRSVALQALAAAGEPSSWINSLLRRMNQESGGNPRAINLWDTNAQHGDPSRGLMQTIMSTFLAYAGPYASRGIYDPFANIYAAIRYTVARYGSGPAGWDRRGGYRLGTPWVPEDQLALVHRGEAIIPAASNTPDTRAMIASGFGGWNRVREKLHEMHVAHLEHVAHVAHVTHLGVERRFFGAGRLQDLLTSSGRKRTPPTTMLTSEGGFLRLHPDDRALLVQLASRPIELNGRLVSDGLAGQALGRGGGRR